MKESATPTVQASGLVHRMFGVGVGAGNSLPVRRLMAAVLLAAIATFLGLFAVAQAQAADGAITGLTLTSDSPGALTVSWNTPSPAPTDYRLRWAPAESDYLSWTADNETDRGNAYPAGDATSLTLSGLSEGTEFKVQARARYHKGEHKNSPWSGDWAEARGRVMSQPAPAKRSSPARDSSAPAAPNLIGTSVSPEGHVLLLWQDPSDDSIAGYQVLRGPDADSLVVIEEDTGSNGTSYTDTSPPAGQTHTYAVKARNAAGLSPLSNTVTATVPASEPEEEPVAAQQQSCPGDELDPTPTAVTVDDVPIVVTSTTAEYFVLYAQHEVDTNTTMELPVLVKRGEEETTALSESVAALPKDQYRVERYLVANPADVDGDCVDDITELDNMGSMNPVNPAPVLAASIGAPAIPNHKAHEEGFAHSVYFTKFIISDIDTARPKLYFMNTATNPQHNTFLELVGLERSNVVLGHMIYRPGLVAPNGTQGVYFFYGTNASHSFVTVARVYTLVAAGMPFLNDNLALFMPNGLLHYYNANLPLFRESRMHRIFSDDLTSGSPFAALNPGEGYGRLRQLEADERPHPRDIAVYEALPNELPPVAGIISTVPQTPLSHVNLRAVQNGVPNAYVRGFLDNGEVKSLLDTYVRFSVTESEWDVRAATAAEVEAHYAASRPTRTQTPRRDLSIRTITPLSQVEFEHWDSFGVKAANVAVLGTLGFPGGTVPDGHAIPFYFYDEFMKANNLYTAIREMLDSEEFQADFDEQEDELKKLRKKIKKGATPQWIIDALTAMHGTYPEGQSLRYRSSTNNEDLPGFNGAGLYDSNTQHPDETEEDGIDKSLKQVYASLWNFRAFSEREFHHVDHLAAAMGVLVHPNYSDELVNGVAVSFDLVSAKEGTHYVNSQRGEDLVTNPEAHSVPEEVLIHQDGTFSILATSNLVEPGVLLMSVLQIQQLRRYLGEIHTHFKGLYNPASDEAFAMEIEFKITSDDVLAIKQARPWVFGGAATPSPDRAGTVILPSTQPRVGATLTATLTDPDGSISNLTWQWASSSNGSSNWAPINGAASATYTPVGGDVGNYLRATVSYTDGHGVGKSAQAVSANTVEDAPPPPPPPTPRPPTGGGGGGGGGGAPANRAPEFMEGDRTARSVAENTSAGADIGEPVAATDFNRDTLTYSLRGLGADLFDVDASSGQLLTKAALDYETEASYTVFVWVQDNKNAIGRPDTERDTVIRIELTVTNEDEPGAVALSSSEPDVDVPLTAALTDPDGGVTRVVWSWERSADQTAWTAIRGAALASYTPVAADKGSYLRATASYTDGHGPRKSARAATAAPVPSNFAPVFPNAQSGAIQRSVAENTDEGEAVGAPVAATDAEGGAVTYALGGADAALFTIDEGTGQIRVGAGTTLDHEADKNVYEVTVTATDSLGLSSTVAVTIAVTNVGVGSPLADAYDADGNEAVDRDEAIAALADYFSGVMTREEAIAVLQLFFAR